MIIQEQVNPPVTDARAQEIAAGVSTRVDDALEALQNLENFLSNAEIEIPEDYLNLLNSISNDVENLQASSLVAESKLFEYNLHLLQEIIKKIGNRKYRVYSKKKNKKTGKRRNLGTYSSLKKAKERKRDVEFFKSMGE